MKQIKQSILIAVAALFTLLICTAGAHAQDVPDAIAKLSDSLAKAQAYANGLSGYQMDVLLEEQHGGKIKGTEKIQCYYTKSPLRIAFTWKEDSMYGGLRASHDSNRDGAEHFLALPTGVAGLAGVRKLRGDSILVKKLYPHHFQIMQYSLPFLVNYARTIVENGKAKGLIEVTEQAGKLMPTIGRKLDLFIVQFAPDPAASNQYSKAELGLDPKTRIPIYIRLYDNKGKLDTRYDVIKIKAGTPVDLSVFNL